MKSTSHKFRLYSLAQRLYPKPFRAAYGKQQRQTLTDMLDGATPSQQFSIWFRVWADLAPSIVAEQINYQGAVLMNETPKYLKTLSLVSALMLAPFVLAISLNTLDRLITHHDLYNSWLWHFPAIALWVVWLPQAALVLALVGFIYYLAKGHQRNWLRRAFDIRRTWIIVLPGLAALGIMFLLAFHDSVHCFWVTPVHLMTHASQVYKCAVNNNSLPGFRKFF